MIEEKLKRNKEIRQMIVDLNTKIKELKNEKKMNDIFIFKNCVHEWVLAREYFQYDERPNKCKKCNLVRN
jgi:uncharacterized protein YaaR (DUF327 family)